MTIKTSPTDLQALTLDFLPLDRIAADLRRESSYLSTGKSARSLVRGEGLTVVLVALKQGGQLKEHPAPGPAILTLLEGRIAFSGPGGQPIQQVGPGQSIAFASNLRHSVESLEDALFQLVIGCRAG